MMESDKEHFFKTDTKYHRELHNNLPFVSEKAKPGVRETFMQFI